MSTNVTPSEAVELLMIGIGILFLFKRLADIDKPRERKLWVITFITTIATVILLIGHGLSLAESYNGPCCDDHFCQTEMSSF